MKFRFIFFFSFLIAEKADLVIQNAYVWTVDFSKPKAEAVAVRNNKIIFVGSNKAVQKYIDGNTNIINAGGKLVLPGFNDNHVHFESTCRTVSYTHLTLPTICSV